MSVPRPAHLVATVAAAAALLASAVAVPSASAPARTDLAVASATVAGSTVRPGGALRVTHAVRATGGRAAPSVTRFYLTTDPAASLRRPKDHPGDVRRGARGDILLGGQRRVGSVGAGRTERPPATTLTVPTRTAPASYAVLACADDLGRVRERREGDNCRVARGRVVVTAAPRTGTPPAPPGPQPAPSAPGPADPGPTPPGPADPGPIDPGPSAPDDTVLQSFGETASWPEDELLELLAARRLCDDVEEAVPMTAPDALARLRSVLETAAPDGMALLAEDPGYASAQGSQRLAAAALSQGSPGLALAALLRAHELEPAIGSHLLNAAALAVSLGRPNEALALLDAAGARSFRGAPMGVPPTAVAALVRGHALLLTGRREAAVDWLRSARATAPLLTEADAALAVVAACDGDEASARRFIRRSRVRSDRPLAPADEPVRTEPHIDIAHGRPTPLRELRLPVSPRDAVGFRPIYAGLLDDLSREGIATNEERGRVRTRLTEADRTGRTSPAEQERREALLDLANISLSEDAEAAGLADVLSTAATAVDDERLGFLTVYARVSQEAAEACARAEDWAYCYESELGSRCRPAIASAHDAWLHRMGDLRTAGDAWIRYASGLLSAYAANLIDDDAHRYAMLGIESLEQGAYARLLEAAHDWSALAGGVDPACLEPAPMPPPESVTSGPPGARGEKCPPGLRSFDLVLPLDSVTLKGNCEKVSTELSATVLPLVAAFVELTYDNRAGTVTLVAGGKAGQKLGGVVEPGFKSGLYVTFDRDGSVKDVGWRVGPSVTTGLGGFEASAYNDEMDLSFLPRVDLAGQVIE